MEKNDAYGRESIEINVPAHAAYNQWIQFESFPQFMEGAREVKQLDDTHWRWRAEIAGKEEVWDAEITEQIPDERIAWRSTSGAPNSGVETFHQLSDSTFKVMVRLEYGPEGVIEKAGSATGSVSRRVYGDLERFRDWLESRESEKAIWRGTVDRGGGNAGLE